MIMKRVHILHTLLVHLTHEMIQWNKKVKLGKLCFSIEKTNKQTNKKDKKKKL